MSDLSERLRAMSRGEHDDLSIGDEAADALDAKDATIARLTVERDEAQHRYALKSSHAETWQPCPGHRGKVNTLRDGCPWCRADAAEARIAKLEGVLRTAKQFIDNGRELGFIRMPTYADDPAHKTPAIIDAALALDQPQEKSHDR